MLQDDELPRWLAFSWASLVATGDPVARFKRCIELTEAILAYACVLAAATLDDKRPAAHVSLKPFVLRKRITAGDWASSLDALLKNEGANRHLGIKWRIERGEPNDPVRIALSFLGARGAKATLAHLVHDLVPERNDFSHRTADTGWCRDAAAILQPALEAVLRETRGFGTPDLIYVGVVAVTDEGHRTELRRLRGTRVPIPQSWVAGDTRVKSDSLWLFEKETPIVRIPKERARFDPVTGVMHLWQGIDESGRALWYSTQEGAASPARDRSE